MFINQLLLTFIILKYCLEERKMKAPATLVISRKVWKGFSIGLAELVACKMPAITFGFGEMALSG